MVALGWESLLQENTSSCHRNQQGQGKQVAMPEKIFQDVMNA
jgi:hypothetical protein